MQVNAELILASRNTVTDDILYTFKLTFPRIILAEVNTHTVASKNTASSRAIPTPTQLKRIWQDPFMPLSIGQYQSGMQAGTELTGWRRRASELVWRMARLPNLGFSWILYKLGAPKQLCNRLPEAHMWVEQIFSTTDVNNLLMLRNHWMAEPHFHELASQMAKIVGVVQAHFGKEHVEALHYVEPWRAEIVGKCQNLKPGEWHLPFANGFFENSQISDAVRAGEIDWDVHAGEVTIPAKAEPLVLKGIFDYNDMRKRISAARCAWISYYMPGDNSKKMTSISKALETYAKLAESNPKHLSPLQHQATPLPREVRCGNYVGFLQFRKEIPGESGGDKVVISVTPEMAQAMLHEYLQRTRRTE